MTHVPITFLGPTLLWVGGALCALAVLVSVVRRPAAPGVTQLLVLLGMLLLCLAAGGMVWRRPARGEVAVMVDLSPSTRSAEYRKRAMLETRVRQLLGGIPFRIWYFADGVSRADPFGAGNSASAGLPDLPAERTRYEPPPGSGAAVLLFSDGRFELTAAEAGGMPIYPVIDIGLEDPPDAAVVSLETRGNGAAVRIRNAGADRRISLSGTAGASPTTAPAGDYVVSRPIDPSAGAIAAQLNPGDLWPENDGISAAPPPRHLAEKWFVDATGESSPGPGWRAMPPEALAADPAAYLAPSVIVLSDVPAGRLSQAQQDRLRQYVRDLGGGLVVLGGPHAFAAGGYPGSTVESLLPLASTPPRPTTHWALLADSSGSMNSASGVPGGSSSLWHYASDAIVKVLPLLPPDDQVSVGSFAEDVTWWSTNRSARETAALPLPPTSAFPHGPTNLRPALETIVGQADAGIPNELLLLTDADAELGDPAPLAEAMKAKHVRFYLLALGEGRGLAALRQVVDATGGRLLRQDEAGKWAQAVEELMRSAEPKRVEASPLNIHFAAELSDLPPLDVAPWNRTWLKSGAAAVAEADYTGGPVAPAAKWNVGEGRVIAAGFGLPADTLDRLARVAERPPRDPRFRITWETGPSLQVSVDAVSVGDEPSVAAVYLNGRKLTLDLSPVAAGATGSRIQSHPIPQAGPGWYELALPAPQSPALATVRVTDEAGSSRVLDRFAVAGRYAPEFDAVGNDFGSLSELAGRTGGAVVPPQQVTPIDFAWPSRDVPLASYLATAGATFVALGLIWWRAR